MTINITALHWLLQKQEKYWNGERDIDLAIQRWALKNEQDTKADERPSEERGTDTPQHSLPHPQGIRLKMGGRLKMEGTYIYIYPWLIHAEV